MIVMICRGYASGRECPWTGLYLESYDANGDAGEGLGAWTHDESRALRFVSTSAALEFYRAVRTVDGGVRPWDGKPDRPLTAFHVELRAVP